MGRKTTYAYDDRGNVTSVTLTPAPGLPAAQAQITTSSQFPACDATNWKICNKPFSVTNERNATTEFGYNASHGGIETILGPGTGSFGSRTLVRYTYGTFTRAPGVEASSSAAPSPDITLSTGSLTCLSSDDTTSYQCPAADTIAATVNYDASSPSARTQHLPNSIISDPGGIAATTATSLRYRWKHGSD